MSLKSTILALRKRKQYAGEEVLPTTRTYTPTTTTPTDSGTTESSVGRTADTGGSGGGVGGTYNSKTGTFTDSSGQSYSVAKEFVPFATDVTFKGGGGGGGSTPLPQSTLTTPTAPAMTTSQAIELSKGTSAEAYAQREAIKSQLAIDYAYREQANKVSNWDRLSDREKRNLYNTLYNAENEKYKQRVNNYSDNLAFEEKKRKPTTYNLPEQYKAPLKTTAGTTATTTGYIGEMPVLMEGDVYGWKTGNLMNGGNIMEYRTMEGGKTRLSTIEEVRMVSPLTETVGTQATWLGETKGKYTQFASQESNFASLVNRGIVKWESKGGKAREFVGGVVQGIVPQTKGELISTGLLVGAGGLFGAGVKGTAILSKASFLTKIPVVSKVAPYYSPAIKVASYGVGTYLTGKYAFETGTLMTQTESSRGKGEILGGSIREFGAVGLGYGLGYKGAEKVYGLYSTRGRTEIPIEKLTPQDVLSGKETFPSAPTSKHYQLFQGTAKRVPELAIEDTYFYEGLKKPYNLKQPIESPTYKPFMIHVTPEKFWTTKIIPKASESELAGIFGSSYASIHFSGLGKSGYSLFKFPRLKSIIGGDKPALAVMKPFGFRVNKAIRTKPYQEGGNWYSLKFPRKAKLGWADIPLNKEEIQAVARIEAGSYGLQSQKYYTTIFGTRVPIDIFGATGKLETEGGLLGGGKTTYELPESISLTDIRSSVARKSKSSKLNIIELPARYSKSTIKSSSKLYSVPSSLLYSFSSRGSRGRSSRGSSSILSSFAPSSYTPSSSISSYISISEPRSSPSKPSGRSYSSSYISPPSEPSSYISSSSSSKITKRTTPFKYKLPTSNKIRGGLFGVSIRRFGKFKPIGSNLSLERAFSIGRKATTTTLGATFKIIGKGQLSVRTPSGYYTKPSKEGLLYIEKRGRRLKRGTGEIQEIQIARKINIK